MKLTTGLLAMLAVACAAAWVTGQDGPKTGEKPQPKPKFYGEQAKLVEVLGLSDEQQVKMAELNAARDKEVREVYAKYQAQFMDLLTADQKTRWGEYFIVSAVQRMYQKLNLTDEQINKIKGSLATLAPGGVPSDEKGRTELMRKVYDFIGKEVLTDDQKAALRGQYKQPEKKPPTLPAKTVEPKNSTNQPKRPVQPPVQDDPTLPPL